MLAELRALGATATSVFCLNLAIGGCRRTGYFFREKIAENLVINNSNPHAILTKQAKIGLICASDGV